MATAPRILIRHPNVKDGHEELLKLDVAICEPASTPVGPRHRIDIYVSAPVGSRECEVLQAVERSDAPMRLRAGQHLGMWSVVGSRWPTTRDDQMVYFRLDFVGAADDE